MANAEGKIYGINGPVVKVTGSNSFEMQEMVYVGDEELIGEVIGVGEDMTIVQVYEETAGLRRDETVKGTGGPLAITLAPGILSNIFDGIERPLENIRALSGAFVERGLKVSNLDEKKEWDTKIKAAVGDSVKGGDVIAVIQETSLIEHRVMIPPEVSGTIEWIASDGAYKITDVIAKVRTEDGMTDVTIMQTDNGASADFKAACDGSESC